MVALAPEPTIQTLEIVKVEEIAAPPEIVFESILATIGPESELPDGTPFPMTIEPWPGGRWYRDLGDNTGHLWAHVQVIKPPMLLELSGPLFMSYPAISHVQYRVKTEGTGASARSRLTIKHTAMGLIPPDHASGVHEGWEAELKAIRKRAEEKAAR
jgi:hypothetical protein